MFVTAPFTQGAGAASSPASGEPPLDVIPPELPEELPEPLLDPPELPEELLAEPPDDPLPPPELLVSPLELPPDPPPEAPLLLFSPMGVPVSGPCADEPQAAPARGKATRSSDRRIRLPVAVGLRRVIRDFEDGGAMKLVNTRGWPQKHLIGRA